VSKRDIYAHFPDKHALLTATVNRALQTEINRVRSTIVSTRDMASLQERLELIGQTLINEVLSVTMSVLTRLVASESINRPLLGTVYFENGPVRRTELISELLSGHIADSTMKNSLNTFQAAEHYLALVTDQPRLATLIGIQDRWDITSIQPHVETSVECFLRAYPVFN
jgi:AcrR family transcriptional regulator